MKIVLLILCAVIFVSASPNLDEEWENFKRQYKKKYQARSKEEVVRKHIFAKNLAEVEDHNKRFAAGKESYEQGINQYSDLTPEEFEKQYLGGFDPNPEPFAEKGNLVESGLNSAADPENYSWLDVDVPIKNQGQCGSCWAFAAMASVEYRYKRLFNQSYTLSEQELVDCETKSNGCNGGSSYRALQYIRDNGISFTKAYPYKAKDGICYAKAQNRSPVKVTNVRYTFLIGDGEIGYKSYFLQHGPIVVYYYVDDAFYRYRSGIYSSTKCNPQNGHINHAVLLVGYGIENNVKYWIMRNSWDSWWGDKGYFKIARDVGMCNLGYWYGYFPEIE